MPQIDLVIFDCDGVLVDSEYLASKISAELLGEYGFEITPEDLSSRYAGLVFVDTLKEIEKETGKPISANIVPRAAEQFKERIKTELQAIDGIENAVKAVAAKYPYCICSNSTSESIERMLKIVGLYDLFAGKIFSAPEVGDKRPKPAPDVYLFAAKQQKAEPKNTIVIEDSVHGVHGASSAHMRVIGFTGGSHAYIGLTEALSEAGAETVIARHDNLIATIDAMAKWQDS